MVRYRSGVVAACLAIAAFLALAAVTPSAARADAVVSGTVTSSLSGQPIGGVEVAFYPWSGGAWSDTPSCFATSSTGYADYGQYSLSVSAGTYQVRFWTPYSYAILWWGGGAERNGAVSVDLADGDQRTLDGALRPAPATVVGDTKDYDGTAVPNITVEFRRDSDGGLVGTTTSGADGHYSFTVDGLFDATAQLWTVLRVTFSDPSGRYAPYNGTCGASAGGTDYADSILVAPQPGEIKGTTTDLAGAPLAGIMVELFKTGGSYPLTSTTTDANGHYDVSGLPVAYATTYDVRLSDPSGVHQDHVVSALALAPGAVVRADWALPLRCRIAGQTPGLGVSVTLYGPDGAVIDSQQSDSAGNYSFDNLLPGSYRLGFDWPYSGPDGYFDVYYEDAETLAGAASIVLSADHRVATINQVMQPRCTLTGTVRGAGNRLTGIVVSLYAGDGTRIGQQTTDASGTYSFGDLRPGRYHLGFHDAAGVYPDLFAGPARTLADAPDLVVPWGEMPTLTTDIDLATAATPPVAVPDGPPDELTDQAFRPSGGYFYGMSMASGGNLLVVGAPGYPGVEYPGTGGVPSGTTYVYRLRQGIWRLDGVLNPPASSHAVYFGRSVATDGERIVVGAHFDGLAGGAVQPTSAAFVFAPAKSGWDLRSELDAPARDDPTGFYGSGGGYGSAVAIDGPTVAVGAPHVHVKGAAEGAVYLYDDSAGSFKLRRALRPATSGKAQFGPCFGSALALQGTTLATGAPGERKDAGQVYIFSGGTQDWSQTATFAAPGLGSGAELGAAVALEGDTLAVGAPGQDDGDGAVFVYRHNAGWALDSKLSAADGGGGDQFGWSVALAGERLAVGARDRGEEGYGGPGAGYLFAQGVIGWEQQAELLASDSQPDQYLGSSIALWHETVILGAFRDNQGCGSVRFFAPYVVDADSTLTVATPGALWNDHGIPGSVLSAALDSQPAHGSVEMHADGSFSYSPAKGYVGPDAFTYHANDGFLDGPSTTISISVRQPAALSTVATGVPSGWVTKPVTVSLAGSVTPLGPTPSVGQQQSTGLTTVYRLEAPDQGWTTADGPIRLNRQGISTYAYHSYDAAGNNDALATFRVMIDSGRPTAKVYPGTANRGHTMRIAYRVGDVSGITEAVTVKVLAGSKTVKKVVFHCKPANQKLTYVCRCGFAVGRYRVSVTAVNAAHTASRRPATATLVVH